jgi:NodT family efflux transporter outer membrane factor (OMF) lipoprotein
MPVPFLLLITLFLLAGCSTPTALTTASRQPATPEAYEYQPQKSQPIDHLLTTVIQPELTLLIDSAIENNYQLQSSKALLDSAKLQVAVSGAALYPELSLGLTGARHKRLVNDQGVYNSNFELMADLRYEIDVWGKLSASKRAAALRLAKARDDYQQARIDLVKGVIKAWYDLIEAQQLLLLFEMREKNLEKNLSRIEASYRLGLSEALDVYLAKNDVNSEKARIANQKQQVVLKSQLLERLISRYPSGKTRANTSFPESAAFIAEGVPAQLLTKRPDIRAGWYNLMAKDAELAVAHKARFPSFILTASGGDASTQLSDFLNGGSLIGSLMGGITTPIFNAGRLKAQEGQARLAVVDFENQYLNQVYDAFAGVEAALSEQQRLKERFDFLNKAKVNALAAEKLSFDQYLSGLVTYATVLESQRRAFDTQTLSLQSRTLMIKNSIDLYVSLGGDFLPLLESDSYKGVANP